MRTEYQVHHIGLAVENLDAAIELFGVGLTAAHEVVDAPDVAARVAFVHLGNCELELVQPVAEGHPMKSWMAAHGPGIHHIAISVPDAARALREFTERGVDALNATPSPGARGSTIVNFSPASFAGARLQVVEPGDLGQNGDPNGAS